MATTSEEDLELAKKVEIAAGIIVGSQNSIGVSRAMEIAGFTSDDKKNITTYQKVRRRAQKLCIVEKKKGTPAAVNVDVGSGGVTTMSSLTTSSRQENSSQGSGASRSAAQTTASGSTNPTSSPLVSRRLLESLDTPRSSGRKGKKSPPPQSKEKPTKLETAAARPCRNSKSQASREAGDESSNKACS